MNNLRKSIFVIPLLAALLLSACSGLNVSTLSNSVGLTNLPVRAAGLTVSQIQVGSSDLLSAYQGTLEQIYQKVNPSVVNVDVMQSLGSLNQGLPSNHPRLGNGNQSTQVQTALGSGFIWDTQGHIVTNNHVIDGADSMTVTLADGTVATATVVGRDPNSDLAVLKVDLPASQLTPVELADSSQVKVGQMAVAIGNPFGLSGTMTVGIISGLDRTLPVGLNNQNSQTAQVAPTYSIPDIIQTDASINPGNSGGVLVDAQGQLIGVTAAIESTTDANSGVGFVIPSRIVQMVVPELISNGKADHPWMGISGTSLTPDLAKASNLSATQRGVLVVRVIANSPAAKAGLAGGARSAVVNGNSTPVGGDVITAIDSHAVNTFEDMVSYLYENAKVDQTVTLTILHNGQEKTVEVTLGSLAASGNQ